MKTGNVRDWHDPRNEACLHNADIEADCSCPLVINRNGNGKRKRKPRVVFRVHDLTVNRGTKPDLVIELHDDGKMIIRESKRRVTYETTAGTLYARLVRNHALHVAAEAAKRRHASRRGVKVVGRLKRRLQRKGAL